MAAELRCAGVTATRGKTGSSEPRPQAAEAEPLQLTLQAAAQIRGLIIDRVLLPGEKISQVELAERIGVSRSPLREALGRLSLKVWSPTRPTGATSSPSRRRRPGQIHRMRELLEDELLRTVGARTPSAERSQGPQREDDGLDR